MANEISFSSKECIAYFAIMKKPTILAILLFVSALSACQDQSFESEEALVRLEKQLTQANSIQIKCTVTSVGPISGTSRYEVLTAEGNRFRVRNIGDTPESAGVEFVSDGKNLQETRFAGEGKQVAQTIAPCPPNLRSLAASSIAKAGMGVGVTTVAKLGEHPAITCKQFSPIQREHKGDRSILVVKYVAQVGNELPQKITLWVDEKSGLPTKRELKIDIGGSEVVATETYSVFELDAKIDSVKFTLEKK